jgi:hypothetical protein
MRAYSSNPLRLFLVLGISRLGDDRLGRHGPIDSKLVILGALAWFIRELQSDGLPQRTPKPRLGYEQPTDPALLVNQKIRFYEPNVNA